MARKSSNGTERGSITWQNQMRVSTYLAMLEMYELHLIFYACATEHGLNQLNWKASALQNLPMPRDHDDKKHLELWERAVFQQQRPHRERQPIDAAPSKLPKPKIDVSKSLLLILQLYSKTQLSVLFSDDPKDVELAQYCKDQLDVFRDDWQEAIEAKAVTNA